jgi:hypothetical protein
MEDEDNSMEAMLWVFLIAILIMAIAYYINYFMYDKQFILMPNKNYEQDASREQHTKSTYHPSYPDITNINNANANALENKKANPPPPKLVNLYNEDYKKLANKNDIDYVNKNNILLYNDNEKGKLMKENDNFEVEIIRPFIKDSKFDSELEKVYVDDIADNNDPNNNYNEIYDYSVKLQKTDLPLANVPACFLKDNKSLKLSENINRDSARETI